MMTLRDGEKSGGGSIMGAVTVGCGGRREGHGVISGRRNWRGT